MRLRVSLHALTGLTLWLLPQLAEAWADAPSCGVPNFSYANANASEGEADDEDAIGLCSLSAPHLLRNPSLDRCSATAGQDSPDEAPRVAERALRRAKRLGAEGLYEEALLNLRVVRRPCRASRTTSRSCARRCRAERGYARAAEAYREAIVNTPARPQRGARSRGFGLLRGGAPSAEAELGALLDRYPELPEEATLRLCPRASSRGTGSLAARSRSIARID